MRIAWLIQGMNPNIDVCFRALHERGNDLFVVRQRSMSDTEFASSEFCSYAESLVWESPPPRDDLVRRVEEFGPDVVIMASWSWPASYRATLKAQPRGVLRVLAMDNLWRATPRQWLGRATHRIYIRPVFDCVMVPGDRTEWFARRLGFGADEVIRGSYTTDTSIFDSGPRPGADLADSRRFLFAGRLVPQKAIEVLAAAYSAYRQLSEHPWELHVAGTGPMRDQLEGIPGVTLHGFTQPKALAELMRDASCLVLPSHVEPFGVVVHEAAATGLPLLVSDFTGSGPYFVQDGYNGWVVAAGNPAAWSQAMLRMSQAGPERLQEMSRISYELSRRLSPAGWARNMHEELSRRLPADRTIRSSARRE